MTTTLRKVVAVALAGVIGIVYGVILRMLLQHSVTWHGQSPELSCAVAGGIAGAVRRPWHGVVIATGAVAALVTIRALAFGTSGGDLGELLSVWLPFTIPAMAIGIVIRGFVDRGSLNRPVAGVLALIGVGVVSVPLLGKVVSNWNGKGAMSAVFLVAAGFLLASPIVILRVWARWRVKELLAVIAVSDTLWLCGAWIWLYRLLTHSGGHVPVGAVLIWLLFLVGIPLVSWLSGLGIAQAVLWQIRR